jgi:hypothetical protein
VKKTHSRVWIKRIPLGVCTHSSPLPNPHALTQHCRQPRRCTLVPTRDRFYIVE